MGCISSTRILTEEEINRIKQARIVVFDRIMEVTPNITLDKLDPDNWIESQIYDQLMDHSGMYAKLQKEITSNQSFQDRLSEEIISETQQLWRDYIKSQWINTNGEGKEYEPIDKTDDKDKNE